MDNCKFNKILRNSMINQLKQKSELNTGFVGPFNT